MTLTNILKATGRSLQFALVRAGVCLGAAMAPARAAQFIARRFFTTEKPPLQRTRFSATPTRGRL
jgi:hypothetical protein